MRLLVLGGTWFVGHAIVTAAIDAGWEVTKFNRGNSDPFLRRVSEVVVAGEGVGVAVIDS